MTTLSNFSVRQGDTITRTLTVTDDDGVAINLTAATATIHLRLFGATAVALSKALTLTTPLAGVCTLTLTAVETAALTAKRTLRYEVEIVDSGGLVTTPISGLVYVSEDIG